MFRETKSISDVCIGEFKDTIRYADGRIEVYEDHNVIVNGIRNLVASLLKNHSGYTGIGYWAIGQGSPSWDTTPQQASASDTKLVSEIFRKKINSGDIVFVDSNGNVSSSITNRLKVTVLFESNEANGSWREFGIYGGNATTTRDSGVLINHKIHGRIDKDSATTIERQIIFTFN